MMIRQAASNRLLARGLARSFSTVAAPRSTPGGSQSSSSERGRTYFAAAAAATAVVGSTFLATHSKETATVSCEAQERAPNPLWPAGISDEDLNTFVDSVLDDSSINMTAIPDAVERAIYKSTVSMTANCVYQTFSSIHGTELFGGHELQLTRTRERKIQIGDGEYVGIDEKILEEVTDRLLSNSAINQTFLPDIVERQLYMNCLKLIFHLLDTMAASFCVTFCGHDLRLHFEPSSKERALKAISSPTKVNVEQLRALAREETEATGVYGELQAQLQASLYGLVLGIIDDLLANTDIEILSDRIGVDIMNVTTNAGDAAQKVKVVKKRVVTADGGTPSVVIPFGLGLGVGAAAMAAFFSQRG